ncbi:ANTAR domain-containing protein [Streptomyces sp. NPDC004111]|uniref:ANTAR domain-containing protein n=1 Tax=Streptomyces sp. NPDC004111 TaxID=3364690 RepID=UPI003674FF39
MRGRTVLWEAYMRLCPSVREFLDGLSVPASEEERRQAALACASALGLGGMAVSLGQELVWFSDRTSARLEDMQFVLGQGPGLGVPEGSRLRAVPDLAALLEGQWPQYAAEAEKLGVAALFVWPVHIGAAQVGTMTGYRRTPGPLDERQAAQGWLVADALAQHVLNRWPANNAPGAGYGHAGAVALHRAEVHQATGILSEALGISLAEALDRLRARAYANGRSVVETALRVIEERLPHGSP